MRRRWPLAGSVAFFLTGVLFLSAATSLAHSRANYFGRFWADNSRGTTDQYYEFTEQVPGDSNAAFADRVAEAAQRWNAIAIGGADMHYVRNGVVTNYDPYTCPGVDFKNGIHYRQTPDNKLAVVEVCRVSPTNNTVESFQMVFDPDYSWWTRDNTDDIGGEWDVEGIAAHEFGHVNGGWGAWAPYEHFDPDVNANLCYPGIPVPSDSHTMCMSTNSGVPSVGRRSLEHHDKETFENAYP